jgi:HYR domain
VKQARIFAVALIASAAVLVGAASAARAGAVFDHQDCKTFELPANDDEVTGDIALGFQVSLGSSIYDKLRITNNGYVWFGPSNLLWWQLRLWEAFAVPLIAVYHSDADTRAAGSDVVTYGFLDDWGGRRALCVNWVNVGYYDARDNRLNSFQLILVDRNDRGVGDVDVIMNYDKIDWEGGTAGNVDGRGGTLPPRIGIYDGTTVIEERPGSNAFDTLYDGAPFALSERSQGEPVAGRYLFPLASGVPPLSSIITGTVTDGNGVPSVGSVVTACPTCLGTGPESCVNGVTDQLGQYRLTIFNTSDIEACGDWRIEATPSDPELLQTSTDVTFSSPHQVIIGADIALEHPEHVPSGASIVPSRGGAGTVPTVFWQDPLTLTMQGCGSSLGDPFPPVATYKVELDGAVIRSGTMTEKPFPDNGIYVATLSPLSPHHGLVTVTMTLRCPDGTEGDSSFNMYIDPSGWVLDTRNRPLIGATVTLYRSSYPTGPFEIVPDGSPMMSPKNRNNPDYTDGAGHFGWDTIPGYYVVRAEYEGCVAPDDPSRTYVETEVLPVPPEWLDLHLYLDCEGILPPELSLPTAVTAAASSTAGAVVTYQASATDGRDGAVEVTCTAPSGGRFPLGTTMVQCSATDSSGNTASGSFPVTVSYQWSDVLWPLDPDGNNRFPRGLIVPVVFELRGASAVIEDLQAKLYVARVINGVPGAEAPARPLFPRNSPTFFYERRSHKYLFAWVTRGMAKGHYQLRIDLGDDVSHTVSVELR